MYHYFEKMSKKTTHRQAYSEGVVRHTAAATVVSLAAVTRVNHESKENLGASFASPKKWYHTSRQQITEDEFDREAIRRKIQSV